MYEKWERPKIYMLIYRWNKIHGAGCAMAGSTIEAKLIYIGGNYLADLRKPEPGVKLCYIDDPIWFETERHISLFNKWIMYQYRLFKN